jgi:putative transposase
MQGSKRNISKSNIEKGIYNTFESFHDKKNITIADFLKKFDVTVFKTREYRKIKFPYESLIKLVLFQKLKGIKFQTQLEKYLKRHRDERIRLGLQQVPDQRMISHFVNHVIDEETKQALDFLAKKIEEISEKFGIILDIKILQPEPSKQKQSKSSIEHNKSDKTREISRYIKKRFSSFLDLNLHQNSIYTKNNFIDLLLYMCKTNDFAENGSKTFKEERNKVPDGDTLLYHLKNYRDIQQIQKIFITVFEMIWDTARKNNLFSNRRKVDCAIDFTEVFYYGNRNASMVMEKKPERGAIHCYKFISLDIVENGKRFTLLALPFGPFDRKEDVLRKILNYASQRIKINRLLIDRGFFDSKSIQIFNRHHVKFLMPCSANERIKKILEVMPAPTVIKDYEMKNSRFNVVVVEDEHGIKRAFATNIDFNENDVNLSDRIFMMYSKRWGIETGYRVKKHSFRSKTTSKNYFIRLFYFLFSVLLYNLWILADILIWLALFGVVKEDHLVTSKLFGTILYTIDLDSDV